MTDVEHTTTGASSRPTASVTIKGKTYTALCPKMAIWINAVDTINRVNNNPLPGESITATMNAILIGDDEDPRSVGILVQALEPEDIRDIVDRLKDRRDDLDSGDLWMAALDVLREFEGWVQSSGKALGLKIPKLIERKKPAAPVAMVKPPATKRARVAAAPRKR